MRGLLSSIGREIAGHEAELIKLRELEKRLIRQYERRKYVDEIEALKAELEKHQDYEVKL